MPWTFHYTKRQTKYLLTRQGDIMRDLPQPIGRIDIIILDNGGFVVHEQKECEDKRELFDLLDDLLQKSQTARPER